MLSAFAHPTVTEADNLLFSALTYNMAWLHMDDEYCKSSMWSKRLVNSNFTRKGWRTSDLA